LDNICNKTVNRHNNHKKNQRKKMNQNKKKKRRKKKMNQNKKKKRKKEIRKKIDLFNNLDQLSIKNKKFSITNKYNNIIK